MTLRAGTRGACDSLSPRDIAQMRDAAGVSEPGRAPACYCVDAMSASYAWSRGRRACCVACEVSRSDAAAWLVLAPAHKALSTHCLRGVGERRNARRRQASKKQPDSAGTAVAGRGPRAQHDERAMCSSGRRESHESGRSSGRTITDASGCAHDGRSAGCEARQEALRRASSFAGARSGLAVSGAFAWMKRAASAAPDLPAGEVRAG
jgi:hypothetical protein